MTVRPRWWLTVGLAPLVAVALMVVPVTPAHAEPGGSSSSSAPDEKSDDDEDDLLLNEVLESSNRKYVQAKAAVEKSTKTQQRLAVEITIAEARRKALEPEVNAIAAQQYQTGHLGAASFLIGSSGSNDFLRK